MPRSIRNSLAVLAALGAHTTSVVAQQDARPLRRCVADTTQLLPVARPVTTVDTVAPGITYTCMLRPEGPWVIHVARLELRERRWQLDGVRATDRMLGRERVSAMAQRLAARGAAPVVAINADFFDLQTGEVENNHVIDGAWVKGAVLTDSPHDEFDNAHTQFAVDHRGGVRIGRFQLQATVTNGARRQPLVGINYRPAAPAGLVLYTPWYGTWTLHDTLAAATAPRPRDPDAVPRGSERAPAATPARGAPAPPNVAQRRADSTRAAALAATRQAVEVTLGRAGRRGDTVLYRVHAGAIRRGGRTRIPPDGAVLSATGDSAIAFVRGVARRGGVVRLVAGMGDPPFTPQASVGGWPRVVQDGANVGARADSLEGTFPRFSSARHPRSAIALTRDSSALLLVVVDGRRPWSVGMSLVELGDALLSLGAHEGMNLDGGGSSALWVRGEVVNFPSDPSGERTVGNALVIRERRP